MMKTIALFAADMMAFAAAAIRRRFEPPQTVRFESIVKDPENYLREWGFPQTPGGSNVTDAPSPGKVESAHARIPSA